MAKNDENFDLVVLGDQISETVEKYWKPFLLLVGVGVAISAVFVGMKRSEASKEQKAFDQLFAITKVYNKKKADFDAADAPAPEPPKGDEKAKDKDVAKETPKEKPTGDLVKDYGETVNQLKSFLSANPGQQAAGEAALTLAGIYEDHDQFKEAVEVVESTLGGWKQTNLMSLLMKMKAGDLWSQMEDCTKALGHWTPLSSTESFVKNDAILKVGLCHQKLGNSSEAKVWFQKLTSTAPDSPNGNSAKKFLRFLQFQDKLPAASKETPSTPSNDKES